MVQTVLCWIVDPKGRLGVIRLTGGKRWQVPIQAYPSDGSVPALPDITGRRKNEDRQIGDLPVQLCDRVISNSRRL